MNNIVKKKRTSSVSIWDLYRRDAPLHARQCLSLLLESPCPKNVTSRRNGRYLMLSFNESCPRSGHLRYLAHADALHVRLREKFSKLQTENATQIFLVGLPDTVHIVESIFGEFDRNGSIVLTIQPDAASGVTPRFMFS